MLGTGGSENGPSATGGGGPRFFAARLQRSLVSQARSLRCELSRYWKARFVATATHLPPRSGVRVFWWPFIYDGLKLEAAQHFRSTNGIFGGIPCAAWDFL